MLKTLEKIKKLLSRKFMCKPKKESVQQASTEESKPEQEELKADEKTEGK